MITIANRERRHIILETNTHFEIHGPNPPMGGRNEVEKLGPEDELTLNTGRDVRIELRGDTLSVIVL